jgi:hypothetical protein
MEGGGVVVRWLGEVIGRNLPDRCTDRACPCTLSRFRRAITACRGRVDVALVGEVDVAITC